MTNPSQKELTIENRLLWQQLEREKEDKRNIVRSYEATIAELRKEIEQLTAMVQPAHQET